MSWHENTKGECNNPACRQEIWWNPKATHPVTGKMRPLNSPYHPDSNPKPDPHLCMKNKRPGVFLKKYPDEEPPLPKQKPPWPLPLPEGVHLGVTHLWLEDKKEFTALYRCPLCNFQNIYKDVINHHIKYAYDERHNKSGVRI